MDSPSIFTAKKYNSNFSVISLNPITPSVDDLFNEIEGESEWFLLSLFSEGVKRAENTLILLPTSFIKIINIKGPR